MLVVTSGRRVIVVSVLLALAVAGGIIRLTAPNPSMLRDIGSLLLVMWVPAIGNIVGWFARRIPLPTPKLAFDIGQPFTPQLQVRFTPLVPMPHVADGPHDLLTLVIGRDGFNARPQPSAAEVLAVPLAQTLVLEFLRPDRALPRFAAGTAFTVLSGSVAVGRGEVLAPMQAAVPAAAVQSA